MADVRRLSVPPQSTEAEQSILGALLIDQQAWARVADVISADDFYRPDHRTIFAAIASLKEQRRATDAVTVADFLERQGTLSDAGGLAYLATLAKDTPSSGNIESYASAVRERSALRRLKAISESIAKAVSAGDGRSAAELVADAQAQLQRLQARSRTGKGLVQWGELVGEFVDDLDKRSSGPTGLCVGLPDFDELTCGLEAGDLVVIAARPGMGKTALMVSIASTVSQTKGVAVFSAEMPSKQLVRRCVAFQSEIPQGLLRHAERLTDEHWVKISEATGGLADRRLWIDDTATPAINHIRAETIALKSREPLGLVLVDYVQLVTGHGANRYEQLREVSYGLKALAKDLAVPIVVLAQLNRGVESREHKRPQISDLRDSGAIEEAADIVGLLYSEGYYNSEFGMPYVLECAVQKNRNGERGECLWHFAGAYSRVSPLTDGARAQYHRIRAESRRSRNSDL
jgi:replicative DNA helicase